jgi:hypothetical protein
MKTTQTKTKVLTANRLSDGIVCLARFQWRMDHVRSRMRFLARHDDDAVAAIEAAGAQGTGRQSRCRRQFDRESRKPRRGRIQAAAPDERALPATARLHAARGDPLWHAEQRARCASWPMIAERWDKGYGHFTTRQNIQFNWPRLRDVPDMLDALAEVGCTRSRPAATPSATSPPTISPARPRRDRRSAPGGRADPAMVHRPPRNSVPAAQVQDRRHRQPQRPRRDRAHDIGLRMVRTDGDAGSRSRRRRLGRTPMIGKVIRDFLPEGRPAALSRGDRQRLQPAGPARQQVQGAHQDHRARARHRRDPRPGRGALRRCARVFRRRSGAAGRDQGAIRAARLSRRDTGGFETACRRPGLPVLGRHQPRPHRAGPCHRVDQPQGPWRNAGRCHAARCA